VSRSIGLRVALLTCALRLFCLAETTNRDVIAQASALVRAGKVDQAEALLRSALAADPHSATLHGVLGALLLKEQKYQDSTMELRQAAQEDPESPEYNLMAAAALIGWKRYVTAVDFLRAAQPRFGNHPQFHYYLGLAYYYEGDMNAAVPQLEEAVRLSPKLERAQFLLANCLLVRGQTARALNIFRTLVKDHPDNAFYWATLGAKVGHVDAGGSEEESLDAVRHALALAPNDLYVQFAAATVFTETGNYGSARPLLEQLAKVTPERLDAHALLVQVYARLGKRELAQQETRIVDQLQKEAAAQYSATPPGDPGSSPQQP
jgi:predicted Zn-dependent protease